MDNFNFQTVTLAGRKILRDSIVTGENIIFTRFRIGDSAEQPDVPETLEDVLSPRFWVPVAETSRAENGESAVQVDGVFKQDEEHSDFYFRELALFAKLGDGGQEVMFGYLHCGPVENYIPTSDSTNLATYNFIVTIPIGSASVLVTYDPEALVSLKKYKDLELRVNKFAENYDVKMGKFETDINAEIEKIRKEAEKKIKDIEDDVEEKLKNLRQSVEGSIGDYVKKAGDTMTGKLTGTAAEFSGDLSAKNVTGTTAIKGGTISGTTGTFSGAITSSSTIQGTTITATTGFKGGTISGTTCTLTGALSGTSATFSGDLSAKNVTGSTAIKGGTISGTTCTLTGALSGTSATFSGDLSAKNVTGTTAIKGGTISGTTGTFSGAITSSSTIQGTTITATTGFKGNLTGDVTGKINGFSVYTSYDELLKAIGLGNTGASTATLNSVAKAIKGHIYALCYIPQSYAINATNSPGLLEIKSTPMEGNESNPYAIFNVYYTSGNQRYRAIRYGASVPSSWTALGQA